MKKLLFTIIGAVLGVPLSYYFQPDMVRAKMGGISGYMKHFDEVLKSEDLIGNVIIGVVVFAFIGGIIGYFIDKTENTQITQNKSNNTNYENVGKDIGTGIASLLNSISNIISKLFKWIFSHPKTMITIWVILVSLSVLYSLFILNHPEKDGKEIALKMCNCYTENDQKLIAAYNDFFKNFDASKYNRRSEANQIVSNIINQSEIEENSCISNVTNEFNLLKNSYGNDFEGQYKLESVYTENTCVKQENLEGREIYWKIMEQIETIKDPEPDIDQIKGNLIGNQMPGWSFDYLSEFKEFSITDTVKNSNRIEYDIELVLFSERSNLLYPAGIKVIYALNSEGWVFEDVILKYIIYENTFYPDKWTEITPLNNCTWTAENNYKMGWKTYNSEYTRIYKTGPEFGSTQLPNSNKYFITSLEDVEIKVKFTYKPN